MLLLLLWGWKGYVLLLSSDMSMWWMQLIKTSTVSKLCMLIFFSVSEKQMYCKCYYWCLMVVNLSYMLSDNWNILNSKMLLSALKFSYGF